MGALILGGGLLVTSCQSTVPRVPTRPVAVSTASTTPGGATTAQAELLDTDDGPILIDATDPQLGPRTAHCVIVVFSDFQCPFCKDVGEVLTRIQKELPTRVRVVFKHMPASVHVQAQSAAVASEVVFLEAGTDAFWRFHDRAFAHQRELDGSILAKWARDEGVLAESIVRRGSEAERKIKIDVEQGLRLHIRGTPRVYINSRSVAGAFPYQQMRTWVNKELGM